MRNIVTESLIDWTLIVESSPWNYIYDDVIIHPSTTYLWKLVFSQAAQAQYECLQSFLWQCDVGSTVIMSWWVCTRMSTRVEPLKNQGSKLPGGFCSQGHDCLARELHWQLKLCSWILWWNFGCGVILTKNFWLCSAGCPDHKCLASFYKWKLGIKEIA